MDPNDITVLVRVKDEKSDIAGSLVAIALQSYQNYSLLIQDESQNVSILNDPYIVKIFDLFALKGKRIFFTRDWDSKGGCFALFKIISLARSDYLWLLDGDVVPESNCLEKLAEAMDQENCGWIQGLKLNIDNAYGFSKFQHRLIQDIAVEDPTKLNMYYSYAQDKIIPLAVGDSANILINRKKLLAVGGFSFYEQIQISHQYEIPGYDWIATALMAAKYGGKLRTGAIAWHLAHNIPGRATEFFMARPIILEFIKRKVSSEDYKKVQEFVEGLDEMDAGERMTRPLRYDDKL